MELQLSLSARLTVSAPIERFLWVSVAFWGNMII